MSHKWVWNVKWVDQGTLDELYPPEGRPKVPKLDLFKLFWEDEELSELLRRQYDPAHKPQDDKIIKRVIKIIEPLLEQSSEKK